MKHVLHIIAAALFTIALLTNPLAAIIFAVVYAAAWLQPRAELGTATLILPLLTGKVMEAFKIKVPEINYFSTDFGKTGSGGFAPPVKFEQEVISQLASVPTISDHTPGTSLATGAQSSKDLMSDVKVQINRCKKAVIKIPTEDAVRLMMDGAFMALVKEAGAGLARAVVADAAGEITPANFSQSVTETLANHDADTLRSARIALNNKGALTPRFGLGGSVALGNISNDSRIYSREGHDQRTEADAYLELRNIEGFEGVREMVGFPSASNLASFFFERRAIHIAVRQMLDSLETARKLGIPVPILDMTETDPVTGISITSFMWVDINTHDFYAAFVVMYGVIAGRAMTGAADPSAEAAGSAMDYAGVRVVTA